LNTSLISYEGDIFTSELSEEFSQLREVFNESLIEVNEAHEALNLF